MLRQLSIFIPCGSALNWLEGKTKISVACVIGHVATLSSKERNNPAITTKPHPPGVPAVNQETQLTPLESHGIAESRAEPE